DRADDDRFMFFNFFFACLYSLVMLVREKKKLNRYDVLFGVLLGVPNYFCTRFLLKALTQIPAFIVYPSYSVATVILISLFGRLFFKEKLNRRQLIGVGIILVSLVLLNL
ncbi:MAG: EamA family transporter, partial [Clostridia bacterium]|nr:EamA family transporter [Clostridia bacterium]